jgi:carboxyl-terminal processing protease
MHIITRLAKLATVALLVMCVTVVSFYAGYEVGGGATVDAVAGVQLQDDASQPTPTVTDEATTSRQPDVFGVFWEAWRTLQDRYYGPLPDERQMTYGAIRGVLSTLDDVNTAFMDPEEANQWNESIQGRFEGIGAVVEEWPDGGVLIADVFRGQPAWLAGLRAGDVILEVDGRQVSNMALSAAIALIRGPSGSTVSLRILRPDSQGTFDVDVVRARIRIPVVESRMLEGRVGYLRLSEFTADAADEVRLALQVLTTLEPSGLVLDLRGNPGGLLGAAIDVASFFVEGEIVTERTRSGESTSYAATSRPLIGTIPFVVLIDEGSASASEIVAGAIQDRGRGLLVGTRSYGKGSVQTPSMLSDGSMLRVTTALWFTPSGRAIHGEGLQPDVAADITPEDVEAGRDPQLQRALQVLLGLQAGASRQ